jgi:hypothetical protein
MRSKINLFISLFKVESQARRDEIEYCLCQNILNKNIRKIVVFNEGYVSERLTDHKVIVIPCSSRPTYQDIFNAFEQDYINILSNCDIWFDGSLQRIHWLCLRSGDFLCLTRREFNGNLYRYMYNDSQDVWIKKGKISNLERFDFYLGLPGCDNKIAFLMFCSGYRVLNPSKFINCHHVHMSNLRNYSVSDRLPLPYLLLRPLGFIQFYIFRICLFYLFNRRILKISS